MHITGERKRLVEEVVERVTKQGLEVFLFYGMALPATLHDNHPKGFLLSSYTAIFNFLNFPVGVIPVTKVRREE